MIKERFDMPPKLRDALNSLALAGKVKHKSVDEVMAKYAKKQAVILSFTTPSNLPWYIHPNRDL